MKSTDFSQLDSSMHTLENESDVAILRIQAKGTDALVDVYESQAVEAALQQSLEKESVKALVIICDTHCFSENTYMQLLSRMVGREVVPNGEDLRGHFTNSLSREREINLLDNFIHLIYNAHIPVAVCYSGDVVTPFFGAGLAADFRYITEGSCIKFSHRKFHLHPSGALPYFLSQRLGQSKAMDLLLRHDYLTAIEAKNLGLIDQVFPLKEFEQHCLKELAPILRNDKLLIQSTKVLTQQPHISLKSYIDDFESHYHQS